MWNRPLGLLYLASCLQANGYQVEMIDCLDMNHPEMIPILTSPSLSRREYGAGKIYKDIIPNPPVFEHIHRFYGRYGIKEEIFLKELKRIQRPDIVLVGSMMTYWYPGAFHAIQLVKQEFSEVPVLLGGIYASLCTEHAKQYSQADYVLTGECENVILDYCDQITGWKSTNRVNEKDLDSYPYPAWELTHDPDYVCIMTSRGCPFHCTYCAHDQLSPGYRRRTWEKVFIEIQYFRYQKGIKNFVFYDDALAIQPEKMLIPLMEAVIKNQLDITFHTPNGLHIKGITKDTADLMWKSGFKTVRISLETSDVQRQQETGGKTSNDEFIAAVRYLREAGFSQQEIGVYLLAMLPGQRKEEVEQSIRFVMEQGAYPYLSEFTPIPGTPVFEEAKKWTSYDLDHEPMCHNNSILPCAWKGFTRDHLNELKLLRKELLTNA